MQNNKIPFILKVVFFMLAFHCQVFGNPEENVLQDQREKAVAWFNSGQFARALPEFIKLVYDFPYDYTVKYYTGACLVETGDFGKEAEKNLLLASGSDAPARVWYYLGRYYHAGENWNSAQRYYNRFKNNADSVEVRELKVDELIQFCYSHINPFVARETGENTLPQKSEKENMITTQENIQPDAGIKKDSVIINLENPKEVVSEKEKTGGKIPAETTPLKTPVQKEPAVNRQSESLEFINFQINERVTYLTEEMFQEEEALKEYLIGKRKSQQLDSLIIDVDRLRNQYHFTLDPVIRDSLGIRIQQSEFSDMMLKNEIQRHFVMAADIENRWWKDAGFSVYETFFQVSDSLKKLQTLPSLITGEEESRDTVSVIRDAVRVANTIREETNSPAAEAAPSKSGNELEIVYKVQLGICDKTISPQRKVLLDRISKIRSVESYVNADGRTVCTTGNLRNFDDAVVLQNQIRQEGIKDAFVIVFKNGKRISLLPGNKTKQ